MMKGVGVAVLFVVLVLFPVLPSAAAVEAPAAPKSVDLEKTAGLFEQWSNRNNFPDSVPFAYYNTYSILALGKKVSPESRKKIIAFLLSCQQPDGGFAPEPSFAKESNSVFTYYALKTLKLLNGLDAIDSRKVVGQLRALCEPDGGIRGGAGVERASLGTTYYGVATLHLLGALDSLPDSKRTIAFVLACQEPGKGFGRKKGMASNPLATFMAVRTLKTLDGLPEALETEIIASLKASRYAGLVTDKQYRTLPRIKDLAATLEAFTDLDALNQVNMEKVTSFINSLYVPSNGGFGPQPGYGTTPPSTYYAIVSLVQLGKLRDPAAH